MKSEKEIYCNCEKPKIIELHTNGYMRCGNCGKEIENKLSQSEQIKDIQKEENE